MDFNRAIDLVRKDPDWLKKCALPGAVLFVTSFIPLVNIAGMCAMLGWQRRIFNAARDGLEDLPEHDIGGDLAYGVDPLIAMANIFVPLMVLALFAFAVPVAGNVAVGVLLQGSRMAGVLAVGFALLQLLAMLVFGVLGFASMLALPEILRRGFRGERFPLASLRRSFDLIKADPGAYLLLCGTLFAANLVGGLGIYVCCVGAILTQPVGAAVGAHLIGQWDAEHPLP